MGTPGYMSPEQATGRPLDVRTDVFSLGVMLYEMVTGARPFAGETPMDVVIATSRDTPIPVAKRNPQVPEDLARVVERCLKKEATERYANADELLAALEALRATTAQRALPRRSAAIAAAVAAIVGVGAFGASRLAASTPAPVPAPPASTAIAAPPTSTPTSTSTSTVPSTLPSTRAAPVRSVAHAPLLVAPRPSASTVPATAPPASSMNPGGVIQRSPY